MIKNSISNQRPDLLKDWDYMNTIYNPEDITVGSDRVINWKCHKCGHKWKVEAKNRATNYTDCPSCQRRWQTSFNELTLTYYLAQVFGSVESGHDLFIPS